MPAIKLTAGQKRLFDIIKESSQFLDYIFVLSKMRITIKSLDTKLKQLKKKRLISVKRSIYFNEIKITPLGNSIQITVQQPRPPRLIQTETRRPEQRRRRPRRERRERTETPASISDLLDSTTRAEMTFKFHTDLRSSLLSQIKSGLIERFRNNSIINSGVRARNNSIIVEEMSMNETDANVILNYMDEDFRQHLISTHMKTIKIIDRQPVRKFFNSDEVRTFDNSLQKLRLYIQHESWEMIEPRETVGQLFDSSTRAGFSIKYRPTVTRARMVTIRNSLSSTNSRLIIAVEPFQILIATIQLDEQDILDILAVLRRYQIYTIKIEINVEKMIADRRHEQLFNSETYIRPRTTSNPVVKAAHFVLNANWTEFESSPSISSNLLDDTTKAKIGFQFVDGISSSLLRQIRSGLLIIFSLNDLPDSGIRLTDRSTNKSMIIGTMPMNQINADRILNYMEDFNHVLAATHMRTVKMINNREIEKIFDSNNTINNNRPVLRKLRNYIETETWAEDGPDLAQFPQNFKIRSIKLVLPHDIDFLNISTFFRGYNFSINIANSGESNNTVLSAESEDASDPLRIRCEQEFNRFLRAINNSFARGVSIIRIILKFSSTIRGITQVSTRDSSSLGSEFTPIEAIKLLVKTNASRRDSNIPAVPSAIRSAARNEARNEINQFLRNLMDIEPNLRILNSQTKIIATFEFNSMTSANMLSTIRDRLYAVTTRTSRSNTIIFMHSIENQLQMSERLMDMRLALTLIEVLNTHRRYLSAIKITITNAHNERKAFNSRSYRMPRLNSTPISKIKHFLQHARW